MSDRMRGSGTVRFVVLLLYVGCAAAGSTRAGEGAETRDLPLAEALFPELAELLTTSLRQSPQMLASRLSQLRTEQLIYVSSSVLYPQANAHLDANLQREDRLIPSTGATATTDTGKTFYSLIVSQPLFHWGALRANAEIGKISADIAENNLVDAYRSLALEVRRQFLNLITSRASLTQAEDALKLQRERVETIRISEDAGVAPAGSVSSAEYSIQQAELTLDRQRRDFNFLVEQFRQLTGSEDFSQTNIPTTIPEVEVVPENAMLSIHQEFVQRGNFQNVPAYMSEQLRLRQEKLNQHIAHVSTRPKINLQVGVTQDERSDTADVADRYQFSAAFAGLSVSWNVFDGFAGRGRRLAAATAIQQRENTLKETEKTLLQSAERTWTEVDFARRSLEFVERSLRSASSSLNRKREDFELGRASHDEVVDAEAAHAESETRAFTSRVAYLNALAAFLSAVNADPVVDAATPELVATP